MLPSKERYSTLKKDVEEIIHVLAGYKYGSGVDGTITTPIHPYHSTSRYPCLKQRTPLPHRRGRRMHAPYGVPPPPPSPGRGARALRYSP